ncbi:MAG TPA: hypothetical protein VKG43_04990 [Acidimicrobiales bacterium]|nr:hypothetical protein [Acidimicrobiales bacterium]
MDRRRGGQQQEDSVTYAPATPLEAAVLAARHFQLGTDSSGREVIVVGPPRLPRVVLPKKAEGISSLLEALGVDGPHAFSVHEGEPWTIIGATAEEPLTTVAAEEYLVMGLCPLLDQGRPVRVATGGSVVRLFLLPWLIAAKTLDLGDSHHFLVTNTRGLLGDWLPAEAGRGVVVGVPEVWAGVFERAQKPDTELLFRCDVPVPWMGPTGLVNGVPTAVGVFEAHREAAAAGNEDTISVDVDAAWLGKVPIIMTEGSVVHPVKVPTQVDIGHIPDGPWEMEWQATYPELSQAPSQMAAPGNTYDDVVAIARAGTPGFQPPIEEKTPERHRRARADTGRDVGEAGGDAPGESEGTAFGATGEHGADDEPAPAGAGGRRRSGR